MTSGPGLADHRLDPQADAVLQASRAALAEGQLPITALGVEAARERMRAVFVTRGARLALSSVEDFSLPAPQQALQVRLYRPDVGDLPVALFLHGGGWMLNDLDTHDHLCRRIAQKSGWAVAAVHYRRAPEHRYPAPIEDAYVAYRWLEDNAHRIGALSGTAVVGESCGGSIAAALTLLLKRLSAPLPSFQVLVYPQLAVFGQLPSHSARGTGFLLDSDMVRWSLAHYLPASHHEQDSYLFPLAADDLSGLPPTLVMTAEFDPLRDDGIAYAEKLRCAEVEVEHLHAHDQMHGFLLLDKAIGRARGLVDQLADALARRADRASDP